MKKCHREKIIGDIFLLETFLAAGMVVGRIVAKPTLIACFSHRHALIAVLIDKKQTFICNVASNCVSCFILKKVHDIGTVQKYTFCDLVNG